jgi:hypothetical protein
MAVIHEQHTAASSAHRRKGEGLDVKAFAGFKAAALVIMFLYSVLVVAYDAVAVVIQSTDPVWLFLANALGLLILIAQLYMRAKEGRTMPYLPAGYERRKPRGHVQDAPANHLPIARIGLIIWIVALNAVLVWGLYVGHQSDLRQTAFEQSVCARQQKQIAAIVDWAKALDRVSTTFEGASLPRGYSQDRVDADVKLLGVEYKLGAVSCSKT